VFGLFTDEEKAVHAEKSLRKLGADAWSVWRAHSL